MRLLEQSGFGLDSSLAKYKRSYRAPRLPTTLRRIPASMTSSVLRLPAIVRDPWLARLRDPVVLFVHPVGVRRSHGASACGSTAASAPATSRSACLRDVIASFRARGARFVTMRELAA